MLLLIDLAGGGSAAVVAPTSTDISAGTPVWGPGGASIVFCGTYQSVQEGVGYGVAFCMQRRASLFAVRAHASAHTRIPAGLGTGCRVACTARRASLPCVSLTHCVVCPRARDTFRVVLRRAPQANPHQPEQPAVELLGEALPTARLPHLAQDGSVLRFVAT